MQVYGQKTTIQFKTPAYIALGTQLNLTTKNWPIKFTVSEYFGRSSKMEAIKTLRRNKNPSLQFHQSLVKTASTKV